MIKSLKLSHSAACQAFSETMLAAGSHNHQSRQPRERQPTPGGSGIHWSRPAPPPPPIQGDNDVIMMMELLNPITGSNVRPPSPPPKRESSVLQQPQRLEQDYLTSQHLHHDGSLANALSAKRESSPVRPYSETTADNTSRHLQQSEAMEVDMMDYTQAPSPPANESGSQSLTVNPAEIWGGTAPAETRSGSDHEAEEVEEAASVASGRARSTSSSYSASAGPPPPESASATPLPGTRQLTVAEVFEDQEAFTRAVAQHSRSIHPQSIVLWKTRNPIGGTATLTCENGAGYQNNNKGRVM